MRNVSQHHTIEGSLALVMAAACWGFAFVFSVEGSDTMSFWFFNATRFTLASLSLLPFAVWSFIRRHNLIARRHERAEKILQSLDQADGPAGKEKPSGKGVRRNRGLSKTGKAHRHTASLRIPVIALSDIKKPGSFLYRILIYCVCGVFLFSASTVQQLGVEISKQAAHAGFIAALYIIAVPILARIFLKKKTSVTAITGIIIAIIGFYFLSIYGKSGLSGIDFSDLIFLASATLFGAHIIIIDANIRHVDTMMLSFVQSLIVAVLSWIAAAWDGSINMQAAVHGWVSIAYTGIVAVGVAYTLQIVGQMYVQPAQASILMSLESLFSAVGGVFILHETMTGPAIFGSILIFCGTVLSQIPFENIRLHRNRDTVPAIEEFKEPRGQEGSAATGTGPDDVRNGPYTAK
ncbi:DMT family transporter [Scardovia wiggsiae]|uniref:DMT family transporter n=1 Tax=Scardovia wiggsiae TaxID=230143 RepID=UPI00363C0CF2